MDARLQAVTRDAYGKNESRQMRRGGRVPAVLYGAAGGGRVQATQSITVDSKEILRILHSDSGANTLIDLTVEGGKPERVMVREYQLDPVKHALLHVDFYRVAMDRAMVVTVPLVLRGEARGVKQQGGLVDFVNREIEIECLPGDIPEHIEIDVSELELDQGVRVRDLLRPDLKWKPKSDPDSLIVHVIPPKAEEPAEAPVVEEAAAPAEPEVIKKGKAEGPEAEEE